MRRRAPSHAPLVYITLIPGKNERIFALSSSRTATGYEALLLSAISPWEFAKLLEKGRLTIACDPEGWFGQALDLPKRRLVGPSPSIACQATVLSDLSQFHLSARVGAGVRGREVATALDLSRAGQGAVNKYEESFAVGSAGGLLIGKERP